MSGTPTRQPRSAATRRRSKQCGTQHMQPRMPLQPRPAISLDPGLPPLPQQLSPCHHHDLLGRQPHPLCRIGIAGGRRLPCSCHDRRRIIAMQGAQVVGAEPQHSQPFEGSRHVVSGASSAAVFRLPQTRKKRMLTRSLDVQQLRESAFQPRFLQHAARNGVGCTRRGRGWPCEQNKDNWPGATGARCKTCIMRLER